MADYFKKLFNFNKDDNKYTEIHLNKKEEKYYFNRELNQWVFEEDLNKTNNTEKNYEKNPPNNKQMILTINKNDKKKNLPCLRYKNYLSSDKIINIDNNILEKKILDYEKEINMIKLNHNKEIEEYENKINELTTIINLNESNYNETIEILKAEISGFIDKNIILQRKLDNIIEEKKLKINEIESYKKIIFQYQELLSNDKNNNEDNINSTKRMDLLVDDSAKYILHSQIERLKSENLILSSDLNKIKLELNNNNEIIKDLNEQILNLTKEKNYMMIEKKNNNNSLNLDSSMDSSKLDNSKSIFKQLNKLTAENQFLRNHREKLKTKIYSLQNELNSINNYDEEIKKLKDELYISQYKVIELSNEIQSIYKFIQKQIHTFSKYKIHTFNFNIFNNENLFKYLKDIFNKIISLKYMNDFNENKKNLLEEEIKNLKIENEIIYDQLNDNENDEKFNQETLFEYERIINKLDNKIKDLNNKFNNCNTEKDNLKKKTEEQQIEINNLLYDNQYLNILNQKLINQSNHLNYNEIDYFNRIQFEIKPKKKGNFIKNLINPFFK